VFELDPDGTQLHSPGVPPDDQGVRAGSLLDPIAVKKT
jgi:hypothetical protein